MLELPHCVLGCICMYVYMYSVITSNRPSTSGGRVERREIISPPISVSVIHSPIYLDTIHPYTLSSYPYTTPLYLSIIRKSDRDLSEQHIFQSAYIDTQYNLNQASQPIVQLGSATSRLVSLNRPYILPRAFRPRCI